ACAAWAAARDAGGRRTEKGPRMGAPGPDDRLGSALLAALPLVLLVLAALLVVLLLLLVLATLLVILLLVLALLLVLLALLMLLALLVLAALMVLLVLVLLVGHFCASSSRPWRSAKVRDQCRYWRVSVAPSRQSTLV